MKVVDSAKEIIEAISEADEKFIQRHMDACKHFHGLQHKSCQRGISYDSVREGKTISCFRGEHILMPNKICQHREFPTREDAVAYLKECNERTKCLLDGKCPDCGTELIDDTIKEGRHQGHGSYICPKCKKVKMQI